MLTHIVDLNFEWIALNSPYDIVPYVQIYVLHYWVLSSHLNKMIIKQWQYRVCLDNQCLTFVPCRPIHVQISTVNLWPKLWTLHVIIIVAAITEKWCKIFPSLTTYQKCEAAPTIYAQISVNPIEPKSAKQH